ncbi:hypothetical protein GCM10020227_64210 [Streptomyces flavovirens]
MAADRGMRGLPRGDHRLDQRPLLVAHVGLVGLALAHGAQPNMPWPPTGRDASPPHVQVTTKLLCTLIPPSEIGHVPPVEYENSYYLTTTKPQVTTTI